MINGVETDPDRTRSHPDTCPIDAAAADLLSDVFVVAWRRSVDVPRAAQQARM